MNKQDDSDSGQAKAARPPAVDLLVALRKLMPTRKLAYWEHLIIAERQATRLLSLLGQTEPGVSLDWLSGNTLDNIQVVMGSRWKMEGISGMTTWEDGRWIIGVNKGNPHARRRGRVQFAV